MAYRVWVEFLHCLISQQFVFTSEFRPRRKCISLQVNRRNSGLTRLTCTVEYPVGNPAGPPVIPSSYGAASEHPCQNREISPRRLADAWSDLQNASQPFYHLIQCYTINSAANRHIFFTDFPAKNIFHLNRRSDPSGRTVYGVGLQPLTCWDCRFESSRGHGCLPYLSVACCQVEVSGSGRSLIQSSPTECGVSESDREASIMRRA